MIRPVVTNEPRIVKLLCDQIYDSINDKKSVIELVLLFHCCTLLDENCLSKYLDSLFNSSNKLNVAIIWCDSYSVRGSSFLNYKNFKKPEFKEYKLLRLKDVRNNVLNMSWGCNTLKILCNLSSIECAHKIKQRELNEFLNSYFDDQWQQLMNHKKIMVLNCRMNNVAELKNFFEKEIHRKLILCQKDFYLRENLAILKRIPIKKIEDFINIEKSSYLPVYTLNQHVPCVVNQYKMQFKDNHYDNYEDKRNCIELVGKTELIIHNSLNFLKSSILHEATSYRIGLVQILKGILSASLLKSGVVLQTFYNDEISYKFLEIHATTQYFLKRFNNHFDAGLIKIADACLFEINSRKTYSLLSDIKIDQFKTFNELHEEEKIYVDAFTHYCYEASKHNLIIIDLSTRYNKGYIWLNDPVIISKQAKYGSSDLGEKAMQDIMLNHNCNKICAKIIH